MYIPQFPYKGNQIIINSDRLVLNSKKDSIFLFADKVISLSSNEGVHINTDKDFIVNSNKIQLGLDAVEPIPRGNQLYNYTKELNKLLENIGELLNEAVDSNSNPITNVQTAGNILLKSSKRLSILLEKINSKQNFTL